MADSSAQLAKIAFDVGEHEVNRTKNQGALSNQQNKEPSAQSVQFLVQLGLKLFEIAVGGRVV